jgi:ADP-ribose pyrophosphatase YjhB (NUDIX family)
MLTLDVASVVFINPEGKLIFQKRDNKPNIRNPNMISTWGGACEKNETPLQAAIREVHEETNVKISENDVTFFGEYRRSFDIDGKQVVNHVFLVHNIDETILEVYEGQGWVLIDPSKEEVDVLRTELTNLFIADYIARIK